MNILVWLTEGSWPVCVDAAARLGTPADTLTLLYVVDPVTADAQFGMRKGLFGRGVPELPPDDSSGPALLERAAARLPRPADTEVAHGDTARTVVGRCRDAGLLIMARDGDHTRLGPHSLGPASRFVLDHAPCEVVLVWPDGAPSLDTLPPPPPHPHPHPPPRPR